jgi:thiamine biosynthesis lipoprotein
MTAVFQAMNTEVAITVPGASSRVERNLSNGVERQFAEWDATFSRFRADSELSRLNSATGPMVVSRELFEAIERARYYCSLTDGWFDITVGRALRDAGYDRSFSDGALDAPERAHTPTRAASSPADLRLDRPTRTVELSPDVTLDCGGFIKGWAADRAAERLPRVAAVDAGGDAVLRGNGPDGRGWRVCVEDPWRPGRPLLSFRVTDATVATSGSNRRRWYIAGRLAHHLIEPRTARPGVSDLAQVTVVTARAELADVLAKVVFLRGGREGARFLQRFPDVAAVLVRHDGVVQIEGHLEIDSRADRARQSFFSEIRP